MSRFDSKFTVQVSLKIIQIELLDEGHKHAILHSRKDDSLWYATTAVPLSQDQTTNPWLWDPPPIKLDLTCAYPAFNAVNMTLANTDASTYTKKIDLLQQPTALFQPPWNRDITLREIHTCELLRQGHHPNVCYYRGVCIDKGLAIGLVFDRYNMTLRDMLYDGHAIDVAKCIQDIRSGIEYIHSLGLVHCDIKPDNIFVDLQSHRFVVGHFDSVHCEGSILTLKCGTQGWVPEDEDTNNTARYDIDWYSLAMIQAWLDVKTSRSGSARTESEDEYAYTTAILGRKRKETLPGSETASTSAEDVKKDGGEDEMDTS